LLQDTLEHQILFKILQYRIDDADDDDDDDDDA